MTPPCKFLTCLHPPPKTQWSAERPLPPPVSLTSQSHHEKPPEVTCTSRGTPGCPASTREYSWTQGSDDQCHQNWSHSVSWVLFCFFLLFLTQEKLYFTFDPTIPFLFFLSIFYSYVFRSEGVHQSINFLHAIDLNAFMLKIFGITFVYGVRWTSHACCVFFLSLFKMKLVSPLFSNKW